MFLRKLNWTLRCWNARHLSSFSPEEQIVNDVINFVYNSKLDRDQALDVLQTGLAAQPDASTGVRAAR